MNRRIFNSLLAGSTASAAAAGVLGRRPLYAAGTSKFQPTWDSLETHTVPA